MRRTAAAALLAGSMLLWCAAPTAAQPPASVQTFAQLPLPAAESAALTRSPDVAAASGKVAEQQALFDAARATYGPALTANYAEAPQGGPNDATVAQRLTTVGAQFTLGDLLAYSPAIAQANASLQAARFDLADVQRTERITVIGLYYGALSARAKLQAQRTALRGAQADLRAAQLRFRAGDAPRLDTVRASVAVAQAQAEVSRAQADSQNADAALAQEAGVTASQLTTADAPGVVPAIDVTPDEAVQEALAARPEIASAQANVTAEEHAVAVARRGGFPVTTLSAGYTRGVDSGIKVAGPSIGMQMTLPLGGAAHDRVLAEQARLVQAQAQLLKVRRRISVEAAAAVRTYQAQAASLAAARRALQDAAAEFKATQIGYRNGASSSLDVESARTTYVQALVAEISALYAQAQAQATLQLVLGKTRA